MWHCVGQMHAMAQVQTALERAVNITYIAKVRAPCWRHCNIRRSMRTAKARRPVGECCQALRPPCGFFCAAYGVWSSCQATCTAQRANPPACNAQCATCNSHDATCDMQPATRGLQLQDAVLHAAQHSTQELHSEKQCLPCAGSGSRDA